MDRWAGAEAIAKAGGGEPGRGAGADPEPANQAVEKMELTIKKLSTITEAALDFKEN